MLNRAAECARLASRHIVGAAMTEMNAVVGAEERRITALAKINAQIPRAEIDAIRDEILRLEKAISGASPRLDSIRLILEGY
jgi:ATP-dependent helicase HepA